MTGEELFLRYAFPCAEGRVIRGKLDEAHFEILKKLVLGRDEPRQELLKYRRPHVFRHLLRYCFPHAFRRLREFAESSDRERWALGTVAEFWRSHHEHRGECRVRRGVIVAASDQFPRVLLGEEAVRTINLYGLPLRNGEEVCVHLSVVVEQTEI
ncbi:MAG: hypothetical protein AAB759_00305 [Patescibacteria group bacterium]